MLKIHGAVAAAALMAMASVANAQGPSNGSEKPVSIVLVHGAFVDGSGWQKVYDLLTNDGYQVIVTQNSTASLNGDVATVQRAIALARHPVVLVDHSYGGMIISGVEEYLRKHNYFFLAVSHRHDREVLDKYSKMLVMRGVEGFITTDTSIGTGVALPEKASEEGNTVHFTDWA